jgi:hypothetical protein
MSKVAPWAVGYGSSIGVEDDFGSDWVAQTQHGLRFGTNYYTASTAVILAQARIHTSVA